MIVTEVLVVSWDWVSLGSSSQSIETFWLGGA
jgi:hypothetical protein